MYHYGREVAQIWLPGANMGILKESLERARKFELAVRLALYTRNRLCSLSNEVSWCVLYLSGESYERSSIAYDAV
jgi:hypothetical protein